MSYTLGIDTSNYATSLAVFDTAGEVVCAKKKFLPVKAGQLGLRQSDALFHHTAALPGMMTELGAEFDLTQIAAVGVSEKPRPAPGSYMPCFLAGVGAAQAFALGRGAAMVRTTHQQGHAAAALFAAGGAELFGRQVLLFHISGGTTDLLLCDQAREIRLLGTSSDLYAGQAVDRLGVRLGFGFPAGAEVSRLAAACEEEVKPRSSVRGMDCSLSGLENQCAALLEAGNECDALLLLGANYEEAIQDGVELPCPVVGVEFGDSHGGVCSMLSLDPFQAAGLAVAYFRKLGVKTVTVLHSSHEIHRERAESFRYRWNRMGQCRLHEFQERENIPEDWDWANGAFYITGGDTYDYIAERFRQTVGGDLKRNRRIISLDGKARLVPGKHPGVCIFPDWREVGRAALDEVIRRIENPGSPPRRILLPCVLE